MRPTYHARVMSRRTETANRWRAVAIVWALLSLAALVAAMARLEIDHSVSTEAGAANISALWPMWLAAGSGWLALTLMWFTLRHRDSSRAKTSGAAAVTLILGVAVVARLAVLLTHNPTLSDDIYRYIFDGRNLAHGINPYMVAPVERWGMSTDILLEQPLGVLMDTGSVALVDGERWPGEAELLRLINNPELHTIYLPTSELVFAGAGALVTDSASDPAASARIFRGVFVLFDLAAIALMGLIVVHGRRSLWWLTLYAWHPLPIIEVAGSGHQDAIGVTLMVVALLLFALAPDSVWRWTIGLALGALVKPVTVPVAAMMAKGQPVKAWLISIATGAIVCLALSAPLLLTHERQPLTNVTETAKRFSTKWAHFGSVYEPLLWAQNRIDPIADPEVQWQKRERHEKRARLICLALVGAVILAAFASRLDVWASCRVILLAMVLFSSTAHPWYLLWALVLAPRAPSTAVWIASYTLLWGYAAWGYVDRDGALVWGMSPWIMAAAYLPIYTALAIDMLSRRKSR